LPPTRAALDAYLEMLDGASLPWAVAVIGGDVIASGLARLALERGGHLRVGLEACQRIGDELVGTTRDVRILGLRPAAVERGFDDHRYPWR
jgi:hypothetical protein